VSHCELERAKAFCFYTLIASFKQTVLRFVQDYNGRKSLILMNKTKLFSHLIGLYVDSGYYLSLPASADLVYSPHYLRYLSSI